MTMIARNIVVAAICFQLVGLASSSSLRPPLDSLSAVDADDAAEVEDILSTRVVNESQGRAVQLTPPSDEQQGQTYSPEHAQESLQVPKGWILRGNVLGALHALGVQPDNDEEERRALHALGRGYETLDLLLGRGGAGAYINYHTAVSDGGTLHRSYHLCPRGSYHMHQHPGALPHAEHGQKQMPWKDAVQEDGNWTVLVDVNSLLPARDNPFVPLLVLQPKSDQRASSTTVERGEGMHLAPLDIELDRPDKVWVDGHECTVSSSRMCEAGA